MTRKLSVAQRGGVQMRMRAIYEQEGGTGAHLDSRPSAANTARRARTCQWIEGEPSPSESCKCGAPVQCGVYCERHRQRAIYIPPRKVDEE